MTVPPGACSSALTLPRTLGDRRHPRAGRAALLVLWVWCLGALPGLASAEQGGLWTLYTAESPAGGPPSSDVRSVLPLTNSLWVATDRGAGVFDGRCWRNASLQSIGAGCVSLPASAETPPSSLQQVVNTVVEGPDGRLWFGTQRGVVVREPNGRWTPFEPGSELASADVRDILFDREGMPWFATHLGVFRARTGSVEAFTEPTVRSARVLFQDGAGDVWAGTQGFGLQRFDGESWHCYSAAGAPPVGLAACAAVIPGDSNQVNVLAGDGEGGLWVGTAHGLARFDGSKAVPLPEALAVEALDSIDALWRDPAGWLWIGGEHGLLVYAGDTVRRPEDSPMGLGAVQSVAGDAEGNVWVGTADGLWHYRRAWEPLSLADGTVPIPQGAMAQDQGGDLWFATGQTVLRRAADGTLERLDPLTHLSVPSTGNIVAAILPLPGDEIWFGSRGGIVRLGADGSWQEIELPVDGAEVFAMLSGGEKGVWLGTSAGLGLLAADGTWTPETVDLPQQPVVLALLGGREGDIWAGTSYGLLQVSPDGAGRLWDVRDGLSDQTVTSLYEDSAGQLWVGTHRGLNRWLGGGEPAFEVESDLSGEEVRVITEDGLGRLWFGSRRGILVHGGPLPITYSATDGLAQIRGLFTDRDGTVWIATGNGIQQYRPGVAQPWAGFHLWAGNELVSAQNGVLHVAYDRAEDIRVALDGGDLSTPFGELVFCTQMVGHDSTTRCSTDAAIPYSLATGKDYAFRISAVDKDGHESDAVSLPVQVARTPLTRRPEFLWFLAALAGASLLVIAGYVVNVARKRWGEERVQKDVLLTLRQEKPGAPNHLAEVRIRHLGLPGWQWRWTALRQANLAAVFEPVEHLPATPLSLAPELEGQIARLQARLGLREEERFHVAGQAEEDGEEGLRLLGAALLRSAFPEALSSRLAEAQRDGQHLRIRLSFDFQYGADLARLPWEYTWHPDPELGFLGQHLGTALVRYLEDGRGPGGASAARHQVDVAQGLGARRLRRLRKALRILVVVASPSNIPVLPIDTQLERTRLETALQPLTASGRVELHYLAGPAAAEMDQSLPAASIAADDLGRALRERLSQKPPFDVVHFIGHAGPHDGEDQEGVARGDLVLYGETALGEYAPLGSPQLTGMLDGLAGQNLQPFLFFLNACQTIQLAGGQALAGLVPDLIGGGKVPAVIGMQYPVGDTAAITFAAEFYKALLRHGQVDWAASTARHVVAQDLGQGRPDWGMPVLYLQARDGFIFKTY